MCREHHPLRAAFRASIIRRALSIPCLDENRVVSYVDGSLPAAQRAEVDAHLDGCVACRQLLSRFARLYAPDASIPAPPPEAFGIGEIGSQVGRYVILGRLGRGGMGDVFSA